jgi:hypothetical protein
VTILYPPKMALSPEKRLFQQPLKHALPRML